MALFGPLVIGGSQAVSQPLVEELRDHRHRDHSLWSSCHGCRLIPPEININFLARVAHHVPTVPLEMLRIKEQGKTMYLKDYDFIFVTARRKIKWS